MNKKPTPKKHHQAIMVNGDIFYKPYSEEAKEKSSEFKHNQFVHFNPVGEVDWRSVRQINLYFLACQFISDNVEGDNFKTKKRTDVYVRAECGLFDYDNAVVDVYGNYVHLPLLSIAFHNMPHLKACGFFHDAYEVMCNLMPKYGLDIDRFIDDVKRSAKGYNK